MADEIVNPDIEKKYPSADERAVTTDVGFGNAIDIDSRGRPLDNSNNQEVFDFGVEFEGPSTPDIAPPPSVDPIVSGVEAIVKYNTEQGLTAEEQIGRLDYMEYKSNALSTDKQAIKDVISALTIGVKKDIRVRARAKLKSLNRSEIGDRAWGEAHQTYRDTLKLLNGEVSADGFSDLVLDRMFMDVFKTVGNASRRLFNDITLDSAESDYLQYKAQKRTNDASKALQADSKIPISGFNTMTDAIPLPFTDESLGDKLDLPDEITFIASPSLAVEFIPFFRAAKTVTATERLAKGIPSNSVQLLAKIASKSKTPSKVHNALKKTGDVVYDIGTAGNLSLKGATRNAVYAAALTYGAGSTGSQAGWAALFGAGAPALVSKTGQQFNKEYRTTRAINTVLKKSEKQVGARDVSKLEDSLPGVSRQELDVMYKEFAHNNNIKVDGLTTEDKFIVLRNEFDTINALAKESESATPHAQIAGEKKSKEQVTVVISSLFGDAIPYARGSKVVDIKDLVQKQIEKLQIRLDKSIRYMTNDLKDWNDEFVASAKTTKLDTPESSDTYMNAVLDTLGNSTSDAKLFDKLAKFSEETPTMTTLADVARLQDIIGEKLGRQIDLDSVPIGDRLDNLIEMELHPAAYKEYLKYTDNKKLLSLMKNTKAIKTLFSEKATNAKKAAAIRDFLSTDSYAPLTKILEPEDIRELERVALSSIFTKDNILTPEGRVNWWNLYKDSAAIKATSEDMINIKELMRVYADNIGKAKALPSTRINIEDRSKGSNSARNEIMSRFLGPLVNSIMQHWPSEAGRSTYIAKHAAKLIRGERVPTVKTLNEASLNNRLNMALDDVSATLVRQGYTSLEDMYNIEAASSNVVRDGRAVFLVKPSEGNMHGEFKHSGTTDGKFVTETYGILKTDFTNTLKGSKEGKFFDVVKSSKLKEGEYAKELSKYTIREGEENTVNHSRKTITVDTRNPNYENTLIHETIHIIDFRDRRASYGSSPLRQTDEISRALPKVDVDVLGNPDNTVDIFGALIEGKGLTKDMLTPEIVDELSAIHPYYKYLNDMGEERGKLMGNNNVDTPDELKQALHIQRRTNVKLATQDIEDAIDALEQGNTPMQNLINQKDNGVKPHRDVSMAVERRGGRLDYPGEFSTLLKVLDNASVSYPNSTPVNVLRGYLSKRTTARDLKSLDLPDSGYVNVKDLTSNLESKLRSQRPTGNTKYVNEFFEPTGEPKLDAMPNALSGVDRDLYEVAVVKGKTLPRKLGDLTHFSNEPNYKSHVILLPGEIGNKKTMHMLEYQSDLDAAYLSMTPSDIKAYESARKHYNNLVDENDYLLANPIDDSNKNVDVYYRDLERVSQELEDAIDVLDGVPLDDVHKLTYNREPIPDGLAFSKLDRKAYGSTRETISDAFNIAIDKADSRGIPTISWPTSDVLVRRYSDLSQREYKKLYDVESVKVAKQYAKAHNLVPPYKVGDTWVLDITSVATKRKTDTSVGWHDRM